MQVNNRNTQKLLHFVKRNGNTKVNKQLILILSQLFRLKLFNLFLGFPIHFITLELFLPPHQPWRDLPPSSEGIPHPLRKITAFTCAQAKNAVACGDILMTLSLIGFRLVDFFSEKITAGPHWVPDPLSLAQMTFTQCTSMSELKIDSGAPPGGQI